MESLFAAFLVLKSPSIAYRSDIDDNQKEKIDSIVQFMEKDLTFVEGSFVNEFSNQRFGGTSAQVAAFIDLLKETGLWEVHVQFRVFGEQKSAFTMDQDSSRNFVRILVNSSREDFSLMAFSGWLPSPNLPDSCKPKAERRCG